MRIVKSIVCLILSLSLLDCGAAVAYARENGIRYFITNNDYYLGDADCDENVTVSDVTAIQQELAGFDLPVFNDRAANVDGGDLDISDALKIQRYVARFDDQLGIGSLIKVGSDEYESELIP